MKTITRWDEKARKIYRENMEKNRLGKKLKGSPSKKSNIKMKLKKIIGEAIIKRQVKIKKES